MSTIYEITSKYLSLLESLEVDEETGELLNAGELEIADGEFNEKAEAYALYIKNLTAQADAIAAERKALQKREQQLTKKADYLSDTLTWAMERFGKSKFETPRVALSFRKSEAVHIKDEFSLDGIPEEYIKVKTERSPDKTRLKQALKSGAAIPGAELVSKMNLQIK